MPALVWLLVAWVALGLIVSVCVGPLLRRAAPAAAPADRPSRRTEGEQRVA
ncbi:MAG: hypothetical protein M3Q48_09725 [Actinomycetota bacterium]|jgi:hypothetical protein|nr:hypothetical protein [Actinomycetota bacterium]